jgi:hypothetical protein
MSWTDRLPHWENVARTVDPSIRLHTKDSFIWKLWGRKSASVIGPHHFYPSEWSDIEHALYHEGRHTRQQRWFGLNIHPWIGFIPFAIASVFLLPVLFTIRFWLELDAETFAIERKVGTGSSHSWARHELVEFARLLCSGAYLWAWLPGWGLFIAEKRAKERWP